MGKQTMYTKLVGDEHPSLLIKARMVYGYIDKREEGDGTRPERGDVRKSKSNLQVAHKCF